MFFQHPNICKTLQVICPRPLFQFDLLFSLLLSFLRSLRSAIICHFRSSLAQLALMLIVVFGAGSLMDFCHIKPNPALTDLSVGPLLSSLSHCTPSSSSPLIFVLICSLNPFIAPHFFAGQRLLYELVILFLIFSSQVQPINPTYLMPNATCLLITYALMHSLHFSNVVYCR